MTSQSAAERLADARASVAMLFPGSELVRTGRGSSTTSGRSYIVAPSIQHPRLLIPQHPRGAAATALSCYGGRLRPIGRLGYRGLSSLMRATGGRTFGPSYGVASGDGVRRPGIDDHLTTVLGEPVSVAFQLSPPRANRKPVLQALAAGRRTPVAFVKVGTSVLTQELAGKEAAALAQVAASPSPLIAAPAVLDFSEYEELSVLTLAPLPTWQAGRLPNDQEVAAAAAVIADLGPRTAGSLAAAGLWQRLTADLAGLTAAPTYQRLSAAFEALEQHTGGIEFDTGASHGDWSPWNMWQTDKSLLVWDWERFAVGVPIGADLVHYRLQQLLVGGAELRDAARTAVAEAPDRLAHCVADPVAARLVAVLHLLTLAVRYETDQQAAAGSRTGDIQKWLLPVIEESLDLQVDQTARR